MIAEPVRQLGSRRRIGLVSLLAAGLLTAGCAAGQQAQTADEKPTLDGTNAGIGAMALRGLAVQAPNGGLAYSSGDNAPLTLVLVNTGDTADRLTSISSPVASGWAAYGGTNNATSTPGASSSAPEVLKPATSVTVPPGGRVSFGTPEATGSLLLTGVKTKIYPGSSIRMTFRFADAGSVDVTVPIALTSNAPTSILPGPSATGQAG